MCAAKYTFYIDGHHVDDLIYDYGEEGMFYKGYQEIKTYNSENHKEKVEKQEYLYRFGGRKISSEADLNELSDFVLKQVAKFESGDNMCIVYHKPYEWYSLEKYFQKNTLSNTEMIDYLYQILAFLCDLKEKRYLYPKLSLSYIFLYQEGLDIKLRFVGSSKEYSIGTDSTFLKLKLPYSPCISPEALSRTGRMNNKSDIFSFGVIAYYLITRSYPYGTTENDTRAAFDAPQIIQAIPDRCDTQLQKIILKCLSIDSSQRYTPHQLINDPFFAKQRWDLTSHYGYYTPSESWKPRKDVYNSTFYPRIFSAEKYTDSRQIQIQWNELREREYNDLREDDYTVSYDSVVECTSVVQDDLLDNKFLFGGVLPLFAGCLVVDGPHWSKKLGKTNAYMPGKVVRVNPNDFNYNIVSVEFPTVDRLYQYHYGFAPTDCFEVIPAFPPLYHGLHVKSRPDYKGRTFSGVVDSIYPGRTKFKIRTEDGNYVDVSYGLEYQDDRLNNGAPSINYLFEVEIDNKFHPIDYSKCYKIGQFLQRVAAKYEEVHIGNPQPNIKETILQNLELLPKYQGSHLQSGFYVKNFQPKSPPHFFYLLVEYSDLAPIVTRYYMNTVFPEITLPSSQNLSQCSYGDKDYPSLCLGDKVKFDKGEGLVTKIMCNPSTPEFKRWEYVVVKSQNKQLCFRYDEVILITPKHAQ